MLPQAALLSNSQAGVDKALTGILENLGRDMEAAMSVSLASLYEKGESEPEVGMVADGATE